VLDGRAAWTSINQRQDLSLFVIVTLWKLEWKKFIAADICIKFIVPSDQQHYIAYMDNPVNCRVMD
jgi:hypothetical protein